MSPRAKSSPILPVEGTVPAPNPLHRSVPLLVVLAAYAATVAAVVLIVVFGGAPWMLAVALPSPWLFLLLIPSVVAVLLSLRGVTVWSVVLAVVSLWLAPVGIATLVAVVVALWAVRRNRSQWAAHDLDTVLTTAAARGLPVLVVEHIAGAAAKRRDAQTTQLQVRDVDTGALATARVWGRVGVGTHLVRQGMNIIAQAPPGADAHLRRYLERHERAEDRASRD